MHHSSLRQYSCPVATVILFLLVVGLSISVIAQEVHIGVEGVEVVSDGDFVRIQGIDAPSDWRQTRAGVDSGQLLIDLGATRHDDRIELAVGGDVLFEFDSADVRPQAAERLRDVAELIRAEAVGQVYLVGHTDSMGAADYNQHLSEARAVAVMEWLARNEGIPTAIMAGRGMGSEQPVAHETTPDGRDDPQGRARNRRVEVLIATREDADLAGHVGQVGIRADDRSVEVEAGGVRVQAQVPDRPFRGDHVIDCDPGGSCSCPSNATCQLNCPIGACAMQAGSGAVAEFNCDDSGCSMQCGSRGECSMNCPNGRCSIRCGSRSSCDIHCPDGTCNVQCSSSADCR